MDRFPRCEEEGYPVPRHPSPVDAGALDHFEAEADRAWSGCRVAGRWYPDAASVERDRLAAEERKRAAAWIERRTALLTARRLARYDAERPGYSALWMSVEGPQARLDAGQEWCELRAQARDPDGNPFADCIDPFDLP